MTKDNSKKRDFQKEAQKLNFEEAISRLEDVVEELSSQKIDLDKMIDLYQEGEALKEHASKKLQEAKMKIEVISQKD